MAMNMTAKRKKILKISLIVLAVLFLLGIASFFGIQWYVNRAAEDRIKTLDTLEPADAVLVLGAKVHPDGTPSQYLRDRLDYGYSVYEKGLAPKIIVSGDHGAKEYNEVRAMKNYLLEKGVPEEDIFMDHAGFDTYDSMYRAREIFQVESLIISTQEYHIYRSLYIAGRLGIEAQGYPSPNIASGLTYSEIRESLAKVKAFLDVELFHRPSKYLGPAIPISGSGLLTEDVVSLPSEPQK